MRSIILCAMLCSLFSLQAQQTEKKFPVKGSPVRVQEWGSLSMMMMGSFFKETKSDIVQQIGQKEYEEMIKHCDSGGWPEQIAGAETEREKLKMYQIAVYTHKYNGKTFEPKVILRVPYDENKDWNPGVKWEGNIYFILNAAAVSSLK
jgi:hypothetical protein